jgi:hypothetical protein
MMALQGHGDCSQKEKGRKKKKVSLEVCPLYSSKCDFLKFYIQNFGRPFS